MSRSKENCNVTVVLLCAFIELIESMPPKRQTLFRGVYAHDFSIKPHQAVDNRYYGAENRSL